MDIVAEKEAIIKLLKEEGDISILHAIKKLLEKQPSKGNICDAALEKELDLSITEADNGEERPWEDVTAELRKKYAA